MGGKCSVRFLHRSSRGAGPAGSRKPDAGVPGLRGIRRSGPGPRRSPTARPRRLSCPASSTGRNGARTPRGDFAALPEALAAPPDRARAALCTAGSFEAVALDADSLALRRDTRAGRRCGWSPVSREPARPRSRSPSAQSRPLGVVLTTEDAIFAPDAAPPRVDLGGDAPTVEFQGPATVLLRAFHGDSVRCDDRARAGAGNAGSQ